MAVKLEPEEGILVVGAEAPGMGQPRPSEARRGHRGLGAGRALAGGVHWAADGLSDTAPGPPSSSVANSKSMMQKRPSELR